MNAERYRGVEHHVGNTPLIRLRRLSELTGSEILGKAEFMNPGGSVKDRAALGIISDAEAKGLLKPGDTIVEGTAGNTGIGLTVIGHAKGYHAVIVIPETQSPEKITLLRTLGAEVITVPEKPYSNPGNYNRVAQRLAEEKGWFWANQFDNTRQSAGALPHDRPGNLGPNQRRSHRLCFRRGHGRHAGGHGAVFEGTQSEDRRRLRRSLRRGDVVVVHQRQHRHQGRRFLRRRHRPDARDEESGRHRR